MTNFDLRLPGQMKYCHQSWARIELGQRKGNVSNARTKQVESYNAGPDGVKILQTNADGTIGDTVSLVVSSFSEKNFNEIKNRLLTDISVLNRIILLWDLVDGEVGCVIKFFQRRTGLGTLVLTSTILILPTPARVTNTLSLDRADFVVGGTGRVDMDLVSLRRDTRSVVNTEGARSGFKARGHADIPAPPPEPKPPTSKVEFKTAMGNLVQILGLDQLYTDATLEDFARKAAKNIDATLTDLGLPRGSTRSLIKTNLFQCIIFCDDSGSMAGALFDKTLRELVHRIIPLATRLNENGVKLRFINFNGDANMDAIKEDQVDAILNGISPCGGTMIGAALDRKVVQPLITNLGVVASLNPMLVTIITDGEASDKDAFESTITRCKQALTARGLLNHQALGHSAVIFQIHYVGSDEDAKRFIDQLDAKLGHFIFCNKEPLNKVVLDPAMSDAQRNRKMLEVMVSAIDEVLLKRQQANTGLGV